MAQAKYLEALKHLKVLQGAGDCADLRNPHMGSDSYAQQITEDYRLNSLKKARQLLDIELDMNSGDQEDPVAFTLNCGKQARNWLESQETEKVKEEPVHKMADLKPEEPEELIPAELSDEAASFMGSPLPKDPTALLLMWGELSELQKKIKNTEMAIRKKLATHFVPDPKEGTNTVDLGKGWKVKINHTLRRTADIAAFEAVFEELGDDYCKEDLFNFKPELIKSSYNKLNDKQRAIFDQCLVMTPGSPTMKIVAPKEKK